MRPKILHAVCLILSAAFGWSGVYGPTLSAQDDFSSEQLNFFENRIRPVLVQHCYECHSGEALQSGKLRGGLLLDSRAALLKGGESGPAIIPGDAQDSLLIASLHYDDYEMPPAGKLPDAVIADFEKWVEMGAPDPREGDAVVSGREWDLEAGRRFWSFQPLRNALDAGRDGGDASAIDQLVQRKHSEWGLKRSPTASPRVLVRRAWFDLLGIPPQPEELAFWITRLSAAPSDPDAINMQVWAELIDHLLSRPEYGERWARHWMDVARFAESFGYEQDYDRPHAYHYRDFLIKAFNSDLPYDQFVQWQIAGDQIEPDDPLAWMATGFLGAGAFPTQLTEAEFEKARYDELDDMVATTGVAFLGLSIGCARCHDHKFDPISSEDYYRFAATFERAIRSVKSFDLDPIQNERKRNEFSNRLRAAESELAAFAAKDLPKEFRSWLAQENALDYSSKWKVLVGDVTSTGQTTFQRLDDGSYLAEGTAPNQEVVTMVAPWQGTFQSLRIEALADLSLPNRGPGRAPNGNFALCNLRLSLLTEDGQQHDLQLHSPQATYEQNHDSLAVAAALDDNPISGWAVDGQIGQDQAAVFDIDSPPELDANQRLQIELTFSHPNPRHAIGRLRVSLTDRSDATPEVGEVGPSEPIREAFARLKRLTPEALQAAERANSADWQSALEWFQSQSARYQELAGNVAKWEQAGSGVTLNQVMITSEGVPHLPHHADDRGYPHFYEETHLLRRGDVTQKVSLVTPGFPQVLLRGSQRQNPTGNSNSQDNSQSNQSRQHLAEWLTDVESGAGALVARVMVNRIWQHHFGRGIVATPNDFGEMGERPTHPELLDFLAQLLVDKGWRMKPLHRAIMTSETYLQGNKEPNDARSKMDPDNLYLWHRSPRRLEAEAIRDSMLVVAGQLDPTMHGPGTLDPNMRRRSVYFFIKRSQLIPSMMLFDWPEHLVSIGRRQATTVAPQALMFMNNVQGRRYAESFARRIADDNWEVAVTNGYMVAFGRQPTATEMQLALSFLEGDHRHRADNGDADSKLQAIADFCQMLMSMNEFIYID